jgi:hypothetical protein
LDVVDGDHQAIAEAIVIAVLVTAGQDEPCLLDEGGGELFVDNEGVVEALPTARGIAELEFGKNIVLQPSGFGGVGEGMTAFGGVEGVLVILGGDREDFVKFFPLGELALEGLPFFLSEGLDRDLVALGEVKHDLREGALLVLHQEFKDVAPGATGEAIVELFVGANGKAGGFVVVERAASGKSSPLFAQHYVVRDNFDNVGGLTDLFNGVGVESGGTHGGGALEVVERGVPPSAQPLMTRGSGDAAGILS